MPSLWVTHTGAVMFCSCLHSMSALNFRCDINMFLHSQITLTNWYFPLMFENHSALIYPPTVPCCLFCSPLCLTVSSFFFLITLFLLYSLPFLLLFSSTPPLPLLLCFHNPFSQLPANFLPLLLLLTGFWAKARIYRNQRCQDMADLLNGTIHRGQCVAMPKSIWLPFITSPCLYGALEIPWLSKLSVWRSQCLSRTLCLKGFDIIVAALVANCHRL